MEMEMRGLMLGAVLVMATASSLCAEDSRPRLQWPWPPSLMVAPTAPKTEPEPSADGGKPANICYELVAFLEQRAAQGQVPAAAPATSSQDASAAPRAPQQPGQSASVPPGGGPGSAPPPAVDATQHNSGLPAPIPPGQTGAKPPLVTPEQARAYASADDVRACRDVVREMRRAGVAMPDGLLALAARPAEALESRGGSR
jgi:pentatricopeptide repeat protein